MLTVRLTSCIYESKEDENKGKEPVAYEITIEGDGTGLSNVPTKKELLLKYLNDTNYACLNFLDLNDEVYVMDQNLPVKYLNNVAKKLGNENSIKECKPMTPSVPTPEEFRKRLFGEPTYPQLTDFSGPMLRGKSKMLENYDSELECTTSKSDYEVLKEIPKPPSGAYPPIIPEKEIVKATSFGENIKQEGSDKNRTKLYYCKDNVKEFKEHLKDLYSPRACCIQDLPVFRIMDEVPPVKHTEYSRMAYPRYNYSERALKEFLKILDTVDDNKSIAKVVCNPKYDFNNIYEILYYKEKDDISNLLKDVNKTYPCGENYLLSKDFTKRFTKPVKKEYAKLDSYKKYNGKYRALIGLNDGDFLINKKVLNDKTIAYLVANGRYEDAFYVYIGKGFTKKYYFKRYNKILPSMLPEILERMEYLDTKLYVKTKISYEEDDYSYTCPMSRKLNRELYFNEEGKCLLYATAFYKNKVKKLLKEYNKVISYLEKTMNLAYARQSEDYFVYKNVFEKFITEEVNLNPNSEEQFRELIEKALKLIYLRPLLAVAAKESDSLSYFDFEHNCKHINIDMLMLFASCHIFKLNEYSIKDCSYTSEDIKTDRDIEDIVSFNKEIYNKIMKIGNISEISKQNPHNLSEKILLPLSTIEKEKLNL